MKAIAYITWIQKYRVCRANTLHVYTHMLCFASFASIPLIPLIPCTVLCIYLKAVAWVPAVWQSFLELLSNTAASFHFSTYSTYIRKCSCIPQITLNAQELQQHLFHWKKHHLQMPRRKLPPLPSWQQRPASDFYPKWNAQPRPIPPAPPPTPPDPDISGISGISGEGRESPAPVQQAQPSQLAQQAQAWPTQVQRAQPCQPQLLPPLPTQPLGRPSQSEAIQLILPQTAPDQVEQPPKASSSRSCVNCSKCFFVWPDAIFAA